MSARQGHRHPGDRLAALVDGELGHAERERVLAHLAHCTPCRVEADHLRRLKSRLSGLSAAPGVAAAPSALVASLLALGEPVPARPAPVVAGTAFPVAASATGFRVLDRRPGAPAPRERRVRVAAGSVLAVGLGAALALSGSPSAQAGPVRYVQSSFTGPATPATWRGGWGRPGTRAPFTTTPLTFSQMVSP